MNTTLFVGNLSFDATENDIQDLFASAGPVQSVNLIMDRETGRSRGFAFVTMANEDAARAAIENLNQRQLSGRTISVSEARPREDRPRGGGGGGGYGGGGGGYGGGGGGRGGGGGGRGGYGGGGGRGDRGGGRGGRGGGRDFERGPRGGGGGGFEED